jgi:hypothetical protein
MASEAVGRRLAKTGAVGTWLGTGFRTSQSQGGPRMAIQISGDFMALRGQQRGRGDGSLQPLRGDGRQRDVDRLDSRRAW